MTTGVEERARAMATFRFVAVRLMETLARWVPSTPEMEAKVLLGQHVWEMAQHADALGRRTHELRAPLHHSLPPADAYVSVLDELAAASDTASRLQGFYGVVLPGLEARYRLYLEQTDALLDAPSVRVLERFLAEVARMRAECRELMRQLEPLPPPPAGWTDRLARAESAAPTLVRAGAGAPPP